MIFSDGAPQEELKTRIPRFWLAKRQTPLGMTDRRERRRALLGMTNNKNG